jgi:hypothetical protein
LNDKFDMLIETWDLSYPKDDLNKASKWTCCYKSLHRAFIYIQEVGHKLLPVVLSICCYTILQLIRVIRLPKSISPVIRAMVEVEFRICSTWDTTYDIGHISSSSLSSIVAIVVAIYVISSAVRHELASASPRQLETSAVKQKRLYVRSNEELPFLGMSHYGKARVLVNSLLTFSRRRHWDHRFIIACIPVQR